MSAGTGAAPSVVRLDEKPRASRNRAVIPLAAIIRFSMSALARFFPCGSRSRSVSPSNTVSTSMVSKSSAPFLCREALSACATPSCMRSCWSIPGTAAAAGGSGPLPISHAPTAL